MTLSEAHLRVAVPVSHHHRNLPLAGPRLAGEPVRSLREKTIAADQEGTIDVSLALLWRELVNGSCRVFDAFFTDERCFLVLASPQGGPGAPLEGRRREVLESVLCGRGQKSIAMDLQIAASTVALNARLALAALGVDCKPSRVHPLLMLSARAAVERDGALAGRLSFVPHGGEQLRVVAGQRPEQRLAACVPPAELAVVRSLVEGLCYQEIARLRGTSLRTVANQVTAVFRRMRVSGRNELLQRLFFADGLGRSPLPLPRSRRDVLAALPTRRSA